MRLRRSGWKAMSVNARTTDRSHPALCSRRLSPREQSETAVRRSQSKSSGNSHGSEGDVGILETGWWGSLSLRENILEAGGPWRRASDDEAGMDAQAVGGERL